MRAAPRPPMLRLRPARLCGHAGACLSNPKGCIMFKPRCLRQEMGGDPLAQLNSEELDFSKDLDARGLIYREARPGPHPTGDRYRLIEFFLGHWPYEDMERIPQVD